MVGVEKKGIRGNSAHHVHCWAYVHGLYSVCKCMYMYILSLYIVCTSTPKYSYVSAMMHMEYTCTYNVYTFLYLKCCTVPSLHIPLCLFLYCHHHHCHVCSCTSMSDAYVQVLTWQYIQLCQAMPNVLLWPACGTEDE
jgi:hypothetical protein